jgi:hypothetical protein
MTTPIKGRHVTVRVEAGPWSEEIDAAIAPLIEALWQVGVPTMMSCQETDPGLAWIEFEELGHLQQFLNIVAEYEEGADTMYNRIANDLVTPPGATSTWEYQLNPLDCGGGGEDRHHGESCDFIFSVGVYFPHADMPIVLDRLRRRRLQTYATMCESQ